MLKLGMHWPPLTVIKFSHNESWPPLILKQDIFPLGREMTYMSRLLVQPFMLQRIYIARTLKAWQRRANFSFSRVKNVCKHSYAYQMQRRTGFKTRISSQSIFFFFFLNAFFFASQFQLRLCDMNSNVTCYGSLLCRGKSVHCNMRHLEYCMSRSWGLYWWFTVVPVHLWSRSFILSFAEKLGCSPRYCHWFIAKRGKKTKKKKKLGNRET